MGSPHHHSKLETKKRGSKVSVRQKRWDTRLLSMATLVATWSKDPSTKVGAVIADASNRVVGLGFNGPPAGVADLDLTEDRERRLLRTIHAEVNAMLFAGQTEPSESTMYVTAPPCANCASVIIQYGIRRVVALPASPEFMRRWFGHLEEVREMFADVGGELIIFNKDNP